MTTPGDDDAIQNIDDDAPAYYPNLPDITFEELGIDPSGGLIPVPTGAAASSITALGPGITHYVHDWSVGLEYVGGSTRHAVPVANFRPTFQREVELRDGETVTREYDARFELSQDFFIDVRLRAEDIASEKALRERLSAELPLTKYQIHHGAWPHILPAMTELSAQIAIQHEVAYASMGWISLDPMMYVLPGCCAIGINGQVPTVTMDAQAIAQLPPSWKNYGRDFRPATPAEVPVAADALRRLIKVSPTMVITITQVLGGMLSPFGVRKTPPLVHMLGQTGSLKTTQALLALSLMGVFDGESSVPETWTSTQNALMAALHDAKDVTLLIDDYKRVKNGAEPTTLIQNYADSTTRARMGQDQKRRRTLIPRGLLLSTGEDLWEGHQSVGARTITLLVKRPDANLLPAYLTEMSELQRMAQGGMFALVGGTFAKWIASHTAVWLEDVYTKLREAALNNVSTAHLRLNATLASLIAIGRIVELFLTDCFPSVAPIYVAQRDTALQELIQEAQVLSEEAESLSPYEWAIVELSQALSGGAAHLRHRSAKNPAVIGSAVAPMVGYYDDEYVYLGRQTSWDWFLAKAGHAHRDLHFSWSGLLQGARNKLGPLLVNGVDCRTSFLAKMHGSRPARYLAIPLDDVVDLTSGMPVLSAAPTLPDPLDGLP